jgi:hypothetical protein
MFGVQDDAVILAQCLSRLCELALNFSRNENRTLLVDDANSLLTTYKHWQEDLGSIVIDLIQYFHSLQDNLIFFHELGKNEEWKELLKKANLQHVFDNMNVENLSESDLQEFIEVAHSLNWRPIWAGGERKLPEKVQRWLSRHRYE